ncbi:Voltage-dependent potassium channel beta subunit [Paragonimus heterotremus]|uniref:Voltage-dependent potassium channel beta subunit n=1 Tax=Paragonimus heterotremus TaxID=100268 RepID=A0A8J4X1Z1_9TREM|nr:Voltage-dependent potassium channel beta subunit [Paragonimus heterotremus]
MFLAVYILPVVDDILCYLYPRRSLIGLRGSLDRLQLDYVDIVIVSRQPDMVIPIEEVVRTCTHIIQLGWAFYWGTCKWTAAEIMQAQSVARQFNLIPSALDQIEYNMLQRGRMPCIQEICAKLNLGLVTGSPLCGGLLSAKYCDGVPNYSRATLPGQQYFLERIICSRGQLQRDQIRQLCKLANRIQCTCAQLAIAWCLKTPFVNSVLLGAATVDQLLENLDAIEVVPRLNMATLTEIEYILTPENVDTFL